MFRTGFAAAMFASTALIACPSRAATLPPGFSEFAITQTISNGSAIEFAPDGKLYVLEQTGTGKITRKSTTSAKHTPSFYYALSNRQALTLLEQIHPYLRSYKQQRSQLILAKYEQLTPRNGKYTQALKQCRLDFEQELLAIRASC